MREKREREGEGEEAGREVQRKVERKVKVEGERCRPFVFAPSCFFPFCPCIFFFFFFFSFFFCSLLSHRRKVEWNFRLS